MIHVFNFLFVTNFYFTHISLEQVESSKLWIFSLIMRTLRLRNIFPIYQSVLWRGAEVASKERPIATRSVKPSPEVESLVRVVLKYFSLIYPLYS